ncbi:CaiB/BaiF CoA transferase family protein [Microbacterium sp. No. 7]|uniref:CaiB/BaiF CoA transferase family protein n=1 Tax=Microbacterium sp. No. 7 TaxID=1714373 RepID=UPI0006D1CD7B|nr:CoA transferase [Microbacterium sp. No. 7]ALJ19300.1 carnitine dehydratase [Microbacterium sp. No. 7]
MANTGPLHGKVVLDLSVALAGPYATLIMAGLGARVIKVENPHGGDMARNNSPYVTAEGFSMTRESDEDMSVSNLIRNRGKESVTLDLKKPEARAVLFDLVRRADVLVENFSSGVTKRLGVDYASVRHLNPRLVYTSISGFGATGDPDRKAMDAIIQGLSGLMMTAGEEGDPPVRLGIPIADLITPLFGVIGTLAALGQVDRGAEGQHVDVGMLGSLTSLVAAEGLDAMAAVGIPARTGLHMKRLAPFGSFETRDGWFTICAPTDPLAANLFRAMGRDDLITSPDFGRRDARVRNADRLNAIVAGWAAELDLDDALARLKAHGAPAEPVRTPAEAVRTAEVREREEVVPITHPVFGTLDDFWGPGVPIRFSQSGVDLSTPAPPLGAQTDAVLTADLGYSPDRIQQLRDTGVI